MSGVCRSDGYLSIFQAKRLRTQFRAVYERMTKRPGKPGLFLRFGALRLLLTVLLTARDFA